MLTVRQIDRFWNERQYEKLFGALTEFRPEGAFRVSIDGGRAVPAAAMALIRLEELSQAHVPLYGRLVRALLASQNHNDGGWGDPVVTALCLRALMNGRGHGVAVERGLDFLAELQKPEGIWPDVPIRRMAGDAYASAFILYQLGDKSLFRQAVRFDDAVEWFTRNDRKLDAESRRWWGHAGTRCRMWAAPGVSSNVLELVN